MTLPVFLFIEAKPNMAEREALQAYLSKVPNVVNQYAGVPIATYDVEKTLDGCDGPSIFSVISFPSRQSIEAFFADPAYQAIVPLRDKGFSHLRFHITSERV